MTSKQILIVEDSADNRALLTSAIRILGHQVTAVEDGESAVERAMKHKFDLIIMDWHLPGLDGFEAASSIWSTSAMNSNVRIVAFTSSDTPEEIEACKNHGFVDVLSKAFDPQRLEELLGRWLLADE